MYIYEIKMNFKKYLCVCRKLCQHYKDRNVASKEAEGPEEEDTFESHPDDANVLQSGNGGKLAAPNHMKEIFDVLDKTKEMIDRDLQRGKGKYIDESGAEPKPDASTSTTAEVHTETESNTNGNLQSANINMPSCLVL